MKISSVTLEVLAGVITGDTSNANYRSGKDLVRFFYDFGSKDIYDSHFPSRKDYVCEKLLEYNNTENMKSIIKEALDPIHYSDEAPNNEDAGRLNRCLRRDGYQLIPEQVDTKIDNHGYSTYGDFLVFDIQTIGEKTVAADVVIKLNHQFINDQIRKANEKLASGDYDGVITNCYSLIEKLIKELLKQMGAEFNPDDGDIRKLYNSLSDKMNLNPKGENLESYLKTILSGLRQQISGLYDLANKASDRHARKYKPSRHHAKLAVNVAFTFSEFLLDSYEHQKSLKSKKASTT